MSKMVLFFALILLTMTTVYWLPSKYGVSSFASDTVKLVDDFGILKRQNPDQQSLLSALRNSLWSESNDSRIDIDYDGIITNLTESASIPLLDKSTTIKPRPESLPIILEWSYLNRRSLFVDKKNYEKHCPFQCVSTTNHSLLDIAAVTVYHMGGNERVYLRSMNSTYINVFLNFEPPPHRPIYQRVQRNFFDVTITYRQDSTLPVYYDSFVELDSPNDSDRWTEAEVDAAIKAKEKPALWMVSHCDTASKRETYVAALKQHIEVTQIGTCNKVSCPRNQDCEKTNIKNHYFYIAFENSVCLDYITEKFFRMRKLIVPIVLDRRVFRGVHEKLLNYTIIASDFESPKKLAEYLNYLMENPDEYRRYFDWTKIYKKSEQPFVNYNTACKVCEMAHQVQNGSFKKEMLDIREWWGGNKCYGSVGSELVQHGNSSIN